MLMFLICCWMCVCCCLCLVSCCSRNLCSVSLDLWPSDISMNHSELNSVQPTGAVQHRQSTSVSWTTRLPPAHNTVTFAAMCLFPSDSTTTRGQKPCESSHTLWRSIPDAEGSSSSRLWTILSTANPVKCGFQWAEPPHTHILSLHQPFITSLPVILLVDAEVLGAVLCTHTKHGVRVEPRWDLIPSSSGINVLSRRESGVSFRRAAL